jgi:hypothetical protein
LIVSGHAELAINIHVTRPNDSAVATESPSHAHLDALQHVDRYVKATMDYGISFSSQSNTSLEAFIQFPLGEDALLVSQTQTGDPGCVNTLGIDFTPSIWMRNDQFVAT